MNSSKARQQRCMLVGAILVALGLSACGGGGSNVKSTPPPTTPTTPDDGDDPVIPADPVQFVEDNETLTIGVGETLAKRVVLGQDATLDNAGTIAGNLDIAVGMLDISSWPGVVLNHDDGKIEGNSFALKLGAYSTVSNTGSFSEIRSGGTAIFIDGPGEVENTNGAMIISGGTAIHIVGDAKITNGNGGHIETYGTDKGDCSGTGDCAIYVAPGVGRQSPLELINEGGIWGNVQMDPTAWNKVYMLAGSEIRGDLDIGVNPHSEITLDAPAGTGAWYSNTVTGTTTFAGGFRKTGEGIWVINTDLSPVATENGMYGSVQVSGGLLQVGNGRTEGDFGLRNFIVEKGDLLFSRSDTISIGSVEIHEFGRLAQMGTGTLIITGDLRGSNVFVESGTLEMMTGSQWFHARNHGTIVFNGPSRIYDADIYGTGSVVLEGPGMLSVGNSTYTGGTTINNGTLISSEIVTGNVTVNENGTFKGDGTYFGDSVTGVAGNLWSAGDVHASEGSDTLIGGDYTQASTGTMTVWLGSKLDVAGTATLEGGTLFVPNRSMGYVANTHTEVLVADGGVVGTFDRLVKSEYAVFTSNTIHYDANSVWLDTTGLDVTVAAAGGGVDYTPVSMASAQRVQGAFEKLDARMAASDTEGVPDDFMRSAGQFQRAPTLQAAQASLQSLSGQLHAVGAAMTFKAIDASSQAMSDRFDDLLGAGHGFGMWTRDLGTRGGMARTGFDGVDFQLNGWLVGSDLQVGDSGVAGFAFGQSRGQQQLDGGFERDRSRNAEGMLYAGWINGDWYSQGRLGFGHFEREIGRQVLLGDSAQGVQTRYNGSYSVAYGESGMRMGVARRGHVTPFVNMEYARTRRDGFAEQGAGGFGLRSNAQAVDRWQAGLGVRAGYSWSFANDRGLDLSARALWRRTLASHGNDFDASFVGLEQWQPLIGMGLSRHGALFDIGLDARLSARTALKLSYNYEMGERDDAQMLSARLGMAF